MTQITRWFQDYMLRNRKEDPGRRVKDIPSFLREFAGLRPIPTTTTTKEFDYSGIGDEIGAHPLMKQEEYFPSAKTTVEYPGGFVPPKRVEPTKPAEESLGDKLKRERSEFLRDVKAQGLSSNEGWDAYKDWRRSNKQNTGMQEELSWKNEWNTISALAEGYNESDLARASGVAGLQPERLEHSRPLSELLEPASEKLKELEELRAKFPGVTAPSLPEEYYLAPHLVVTDDGKVYQKEGGKSSVGEFDFDTGEYKPTFSGQLEAGIGGLYMAGAGVAGRFGNEALQEDFLEKALSKIQGVPAPKGTLDALVRTSPAMVALGVAAITGGVFAAPVAGVLLGASNPFWSTVIISMGAAALSRPLESAMEAGGSYVEAINKGKSHEEASSIYDEVFNKNMFLIGGDAAQFALAFTRIPGLSSASKWLKPIITGAKVTAIGLSEAGEEAYQEYVIRSASGEEFKLDEGLKQAITIGFIYGAGLGGIGQVYSDIINYTKSNLTSGAQTEFERQKKVAVDKGLNEQEAEYAALAEIADRPDVVAIIKQAVKNAEAIIEGKALEAAIPPSAQAVQAGTAELAKEPWQMTRGEYVNQAREWRLENMPRLTGRFLEDELSKVSEGHKSVVRNALGQGKPVPPEVLKDYPDLVPPTGGVTPATGAEVVPEQVAPQAPAQQVNEIHERGKAEPSSIAPEESKYAHIEMGAPDGPKPPKPPQPPDKVGKPQEPDDILSGILESQTKGERVDETVTRLYGAAARNVKRRTNIIVKKGDWKLKDLGIGVVKRGELVPRDADKSILLELYNALHNPSKVVSGEIAIPKGFEEVYEELRGLADWDTASRLDFDPNAATIEDWFFRGWKPPEGMFKEGIKGQLGIQPKELRMPRVDATFEEMIDLGFEPLFWNPYQQWAYRHNLGEIYREQMQLIAHLKSMGDEFIRPDAGGPLPVGWKIPRIGPAFEGKPFSATDADGNPTVMFSRRWAVPNRTANLLEQMFGRRADIGRINIGGKTIDPLAIIDWIAFVPKRAKLMFSYFQHIDFLTRSGSGSWAKAVDDIVAGKPIDAAIAPMRFPASVIEILQANFNPGKRLSLLEQMDDTTPLVQGRPDVHLKGISEAGLSTMDVTIWAEEMDKLMHSVAENTGIWGKVKGLGSSLIDVESAMRRGLFQGVYPASMITDIKKNIATMMVRQHTTATDKQINGYIAKEANIKYSTIPPEQSVIQNVFIRETLRRIAFSFSESEALLRQTTRMFHGPNKKYWVKQNIGVYLFVLVMANIIHMASTGEPLPKERYVPISKDNWGPLPFGYNAKFASPTLPWQGRGDVELTVDLMGQMDTAFRVLDPGFFLTARMSVPMRALLNQFSGTDFYGAPIDDVGPGGVISRTAQLALDLFSPIGIGGISAEAMRQYIPGAEEIIPRGEDRLGMFGLGMQATGINIRAEGTNLLLDRYAKESGFLKADGAEVQNWSDLEPAQKDKLLENEELIEELSQRSKTSVERGYPGSQGYATLEELDSQRIERGEYLVDEYKDGSMDSYSFRQEFGKLKVEIAARKSQVDEDFQLFKDDGELPDDPNKRALVEFYNLYDEAKRLSGVMDWGKFEIMESRLRRSWTREQRGYVDRNIGLTEWGLKMSKYVEANRILQDSGYWDITGDDQYNRRKEFRIDNPRIDSILQEWYGYEPLEEKRDEQKSGRYSIPEGLFDGEQPGPEIEPEKEGRYKIPAGLFD